MQKMFNNHTCQYPQTIKLHSSAQMREIDGASSELRTSRQRYATLIETLPHGVEECTVDGIITFSNSAHNRMLGYADGELIGRSIGELIPDADKRAALPGLLKRLAEHLDDAQLASGALIAAMNRLISVML